MNQDRREFLSVARALPGRLDSQETAWLLGFAVHDIPILVRAGLLKPLGHPPANCTKYFATDELVRLRSDARWLAKASDAILKHWKQKNENRTPSEAKSAQSVAPARATP
jgi:hypothetical protein